MTDAAESSAGPLAPLPPILQADWSRPPLARRPWYRTVAPAYLGIFIWPAFFDQLWLGEIAQTSIGWLFASAIGSALVCYSLLYHCPAMWGLESGRPLSIVAASTFGTLGSEWLTGVAVGLASIVWYAVAIGFALDSTLAGLVSCGLIEEPTLASWRAGPIAVKPPVCLATALFWIWITGMASVFRLVGVIVALMRVYAPVVLLLLSAVAFWFLPGILGSAARTSMSLTASSSGLAGSGEYHSAVQLICGFFAMAGLLGADWSGLARRKSDVALAGLTGIVASAAWTASMSLFAVMGAAARLRLGGRLPEHLPAGVLPFSFRWAVFQGLGGIAAGVILILFGLASLAPASYSCRVYGVRLSNHWPRMRRPVSTSLGALAAFILVATSCASHLTLIFAMMGDVFAPVIGTMIADCLRQKGRWGGVRQAVNTAGVWAWVAGCAISLALELAMTLNADLAPLFQLNAIYGLLASAAVYLLLAALGMERPLTRMPRVDTEGAVPEGP